MELLGLALLAVALFFVVRKLTLHVTRPPAPVRESAVETWARGEIARLIAERIERDEVDVSTTLRGEPDPDLVTRIEHAVGRVEVVYERAHDARGAFDVRVEIRFENGDLARAPTRIPEADLPTDVASQLADSGAALVFREWVLPWREARA